MKTLKKILIGLGILILVLILISFLLPKTYRVEKTVHISAEPHVIFDLTRHLNKWDLWTVWTKEQDSTVVFTMTGTDGQPGSQRNWVAKKMGSGSIIIRESVPNELFAYELIMDEGSFISQGLITLKKQEDSVEVTWIQTGDLGYNPLARYGGLFMKGLLGNDLEKGLNKLKMIAEERKKWPVMETVQMPEQITLLIRDSAGPETYGQVMGKGFGELMNFIKSEKLVCKSSPFAIYLSWDSVTMFSVMDLGIAVEKADREKGRIRIETIPAREVAIAHYFGPYDKTAPTYYLLEQYIRESGKQVAGGPWEIYITDPEMVKDTSLWQTDILFPVK